MIFSRYWFIEFSDGEIAGLEFDHEVSSQEAHDLFVDEYCLEFIYCWPAQKWQIHNAGVDVY